MKTTTDSTAIPAVGTGATITEPTGDQQACLIVNACTLGRRVLVQYTRGGQPYPLGARRTFKMTLHGWREAGTRGRGASLLIGSQAAQPV